MARVQRLQVPSQVHLIFNDLCFKAGCDERIFLYEDLVDLVKEVIHEVCEGATSHEQLADRLLRDFLRSNGHTYFGTLPRDHLEGGAPVYDGTKSEVTNRFFPLRRMILFAISGLSERTVHPLQAAGKADLDDHRALNQASEIRPEDADSSTILTDPEEDDDADYSNASEISGQSEDENRASRRSHSGRRTAHRSFMHGNGGTIQFIDRRKSVANDCHHVSGTVVNTVLSAHESVSASVGAGPVFENVSSVFPAIEFESEDQLTHTMLEWQRNNHRHSFPGTTRRRGNSARGETSRSVRIGNELALVRRFYLGDRRMAWVLCRQNGSVLYVQRSHGTKVWVGETHGFRSNFTLSGQGNLLLSILDSSEGSTKSSGRTQKGKDLTGLNPSFRASDKFPEYTWGNHGYRATSRKIYELGRKVIDECDRCIRDNIECMVLDGYQRCAYCTARCAVDICSAVSPTGHASAKRKLRTHSDINDEFIEITSSGNESSQSSKRPKHITRQSHDDKRSLQSKVKSSSEQDAETCHNPENNLQKTHRPSTEADRQSLEKPSSLLAEEKEIPNSAVSERYEQLEPDTANLKEDLFKPKPRAKMWVELQVRTRRGRWQQWLFGSIWENTVATLFAHVEQHYEKEPNSFEMIECAFPEHRRRGTKLMILRDDKSLGMLEELIDNMAKEGTYRGAVPVQLLPVEDDEEEVELRRE